MVPIVADSRPVFKKAEQEIEDDRGNLKAL